MTDYFNVYDLEPEERPNNLMSEETLDELDTQDKEEDTNQQEN
jgi:hypothetical protein